MVKISKHEDCRAGLLVYSVSTICCTNFAESGHIGAMVTGGVLILGIVAFSKGNSGLSQKMMRYRVSAQAFTLLALGYGAYATAQRKQVDAANSRR